MASQDVELTDVSNSEAFKVLEQLVADGAIDGSKAEAAKAKYIAIHDALVTTMSNEQSLLEKAKGLKSQLDDDKEDLQVANEPSGEEQEAQVDQLKEDLDQAKAEASLCEEREQLQQLEIIEMQRQRNELQAEMDQINEEHRQALQPQIQALDQEIHRLQLELEGEAPKLAEAQSEAEKFRKQVEEIMQEISDLQKEKMGDHQELQKWSAKPEKLRRQTDILTNSLKGLRAQDESMTTKSNDVDIELNKSNAQVAELEGDHARALAALDRSRVNNETKERGIDDIRKDLELASIDADQLLANQVNLDMQIKAMGTDLKREMDILGRAIKEKDNSLRKYKKAELALQNVEDQLPPLKMTKERLGVEKTGIGHERKKAEAELLDVKRDVDVFMSQYLKEEAVGKDKAELFAASFDELNELEAEVVQLKAEEQDRERQIQELASKRDNASRMVSVKVQRMRDTQELVKVKEIIASDLKKVRKDTVARVKDFQQLYDLVKSQRNKFVNLIQAANQSCAEMREKLKILSNEVDILRNESTEKDKLLSKERVAHSTTMMQRDAIRAELNKCAMTFRKKQENVDEQILDMDKLNSLINTAEKEMLRLKKQYETVVESRNFTGIMLIDRNDELCILYEKANIQEEVSTQGSMAISKLDDEVRILNLECREVERSIHVTRRLLPEIPVLDENVALLQKELLEARRESEKLSLQLEDPENKGRWRRLEGKIPTSEELQAKMNQLEERLNDKKEQLLEKELILEEITGLSDRLRGQAAEGRADTLQLAKKVNDYQSRIRAVTRKLMATISELSMYQATAIKLKAERDDLSEEASEASVRLENGEPPTADAEREWFRKERERVTLQLMRQAAAEAQEVAESAGETLQTTAETRPNAYIPEELGIPKPYGSYAPFKPAEPGSTMRHIRKPQPKEIVI